jgi:hypothetical protein
VSFKAAATWLILGFSLAASLEALAAGSGTATQKPAVIERKIYDPAHLPTPAPPIASNESGVCVSTSHCVAAIETQVAARRQTAAGFEADVQVLSARATIALNITLWLPKDAPQWLIEHEETHRQIDDRVYATAGKVALAAAQNCAGRIFTGSGTTAAAAEKDAILKAQQSLINDYNTHACSVWARVNDIFDQLTAHGRKSDPARAHPVDAKTAMEAAFTQYAKEAAAATQPSATQPDGSGLSRKNPAAAASTQKR